MIFHQVRLNRMNEYICKKYIQMNSFLSSSSVPFTHFNRIPWYLYVVLALLVVGGGYYLYQMYIQRKTINYRENTEGNGNGQSGTGQDVEIYLFYVDWCPHCKTAKPEWEQIKTKYQGKQINGYTLVFHEINCTTESPDVTKLMDQFKIESYPTIKMVKNNQIIEFDAKPTQSNLTQFFNSTI